MVETTCSSPLLKEEEKKRYHAFARGRRLYRQILYRNHWS